MRTAITALLVVLTASAGAQELLQNGRFEGDWQRVPPGWHSNNVGNNDMRLERGPGRRGHAGLRVVCPRFDGGGVQWHSDGFPVKAGQAYTITLWARGKIRSGMYVGIRRLKAPFDSHLERYIHVDPAWRRYTLVGSSSADDPWCGLYFCFIGEGWVEIADVSLRPGAFPPTMPTVDTASVKGNRVYNGSFELGTAAWVPVGARHEVVTGGAPVGTRYVRLGGRLLEGRPFVTTPGRRYTISAWLRRPEGPARATIEMVEYMDGAGDNPIERARLGDGFEVEPSWTRVHVTGVWACNYTVGAIPRIQCAADGLEVDGVQVEEGELTPFSPRDPVEAAASVPMAERYLAPGERVRVRVTVVAQRPLPARLLIDVRVVDLWGRTVSRRRVAFHASGSRTSGVVPVALPRSGLYRVEVRPAGGGSDDVVVGVLPALATVLHRPDSFFGTHASPSLDPRSPDLALTISARAGCVWHRLHDFGTWPQWAMVEPNRGDRHWFDQEIDHIRSRGYSILGVLESTPAWAGRTDRAGGQGRPPRDLQEFAAYVRDTVAHYRNRIHAWEVWNEPWFGYFFNGTPEEYGELLKVAGKACHEADPGCTVVGVCATLTAEDWCERVLRTSGTQCFDAFSYHRYFAPGAVRERKGEEPLVVREIAWVRNLMDKYGGAKPIWMTEGGVACPSFHGWLPPDGYATGSVEAAETVAKAAVLMRSAGVRRWIYYYAGYAEGGRGDYYTLGNAMHVSMDYDGSPKATMLAVAAADRFIGRGEFVRRESRGPVRWYRFRDGRRRVAVVWREGDGGAVLVRLEPDARAYDLMGRELAGSTVRVGTSPVYVVNTRSRIGVIAEDVTNRTLRISGQCLAMDLSVER